MKHISYALLTALLASTSVQAAVTYDKLDQWIDKHAQCFACHDDGEAMKKWLVDHKDESEQLSSLAPLIHQGRRTTVVTFRQKTAEPLS